jgi:hypothetical protein
MIDFGQDIFRFDDSPISLCFSDWSVSLQETFIWTEEAPKLGLEINSMQEDSAVLQYCFMVVIYHNTLLIIQLAIGVFLRSLLEMDAFGR